MFRVEMLPVRHGDCIFLEYGAAADPHRVLIDAGPYYAFDDVSDRIDQLASSGLTFELFVITHIDADHIDGAIKLLGEHAQGVSFQDVWFNDWHHLRPGRQYSSAPADKLGPPHGEMLSALILERHLPWNVAFAGQPVSIEASGALPVKRLTGGLKLTLLSPSPQELANLDRVWEDEVRKWGLEPGSRQAVLERLRKDARYQPPPDLLGESRPDIRSLAKNRFAEHITESNASSIAFLAEYEGKRCLFAADAQPSLLARSLSRLSEYVPGKKLHLDALKVSHHGSRGNTDPALLRMLECKHFLISTNGAGRPRHPHAETISRIIQECGPNVELWFNYLSDTTEVWDDEGLRKRYQYVTHYPETEQGCMSLGLPS